MTIKVTLLLSITLFECWLPNIYFDYHCARAAIFRQRQGFAVVLQSAVPRLTISVEREHAS